MRRFWDSLDFDIKCAIGLVAFYIVVYLVADFCEWIGWMFWRY